MNVSRNAVIEEVLTAINSVQDHNEPMPKEFQPYLDEQVKELGAEFMIRAGAEVLKQTIIEEVTAMKG